MLYFVLLYTTAKMFTFVLLYFLIVCLIITATLEKGFGQVLPQTIKPCEFTALCKKYLVSLNLPGIAQCAMCYV